MAVGQHSDDDAGRPIFPHDCSEGGAKLVDRLADRVEPGGEAAERRLCRTTNDESVAVMARERGSSQLLDTPRKQKKPPE